MARDYEAYGLGLGRMVQGYRGGYGLRLGLMV